MHVDITGCMYIHTFYNSFVMVNMKEILFIQLTIVIQEYLSNLQTSICFNQFLVRLKIVLVTCVHVYFHQNNYTTHLMIKDNQ